MVVVLDVLKKMCEYGLVEFPSIFFFFFLLSPYQRPMVQIIDYKDMNSHVMKNQKSIKLVLKFIQMLYYSIKHFKRL